MVSVKPILFNAGMVRAILAGEKTQTRRIVKNPDHIMVGKCSWAVGDLLWVREAFLVFGGGCVCGGEYCVCPKAGSVIYRCDDNAGEVEKWKPSIHMPKWASRITLEITDVRFERIQSISEKDAIAEGFDRGRVFRRAWQQIYGDQSWQNNDWVWVVEFKPIFKNVLAVLDEQKAVAHG